MLLKVEILLQEPELQELKSLEVSLHRIDAKPQSRKEWLMSVFRPKGDQVWTAGTREEKERSEAGEEPEQVFSVLLPSYQAFGEPKDRIGWIWCLVPCFLMKLKKRKAIL